MVATEFRGHFSDKSTTNYFQKPMTSKGRAIHGPLLNFNHYISPFFLPSTHCIGSERIFEQWIFFQNIDEIQLLLITLSPNA